MKKKYTQCYLQLLNLSLKELVMLFLLRRSFISIKICFLLLISLSLQIHQAAAQETKVEDCLPGLQHYFGLDDNQGETYTDYLTQQNLVCTDCPSTARSLFAGAQQFNDKNKLDFKDVANFNWGLEDSFTIEFWMQTKAKSSGNTVIIGRSPKDTGFLWWIGVDKDGYGVFELWDKQRNGFDARYTGKKINDGQWHHIAFVRDNKIKYNKLYIDGFAVVAFEYHYKTGFDSNSPVNIGYLDLLDGYHYTGLLDELKLYNRALTDLELRGQYNNGAGNYCGPKSIAPTIISKAVTFGVTGQAYKYTLKATGNPKPTYKLVSGPEGLQVHPQTGEVAWAPSLDGVYTVVLQANNSVGQEEQTFKIDVKKGSGEKLGIVHHWMFNEISGQEYKDYYTPYLATSTKDSKPTPTFGVIGSAQRYDGKNSGVIINQSENFNWKAEDDFSVELWVKTSSNATDNRVIIGRDAKDSFSHWWIGLDSDSRAGFQLIDAVFEEKYIGGKGPKLNDGKWHQLVTVRDNASQLNSLYVDGKKIDEKKFSYTGGFETQAPVTIGFMDRASGYRYEGAVDEVKLFARALSATEINDRYSAVYDAYTELLSFDGHYRVNEVDLSWTTASEYLNAYFVIERASADGQFVEIGRIKALGTTSIATTYTFKDLKPLNGLNQYRLKIIKTDGLFTYSPIVQVDKYGPSASSFLVYPNPVSNGEVMVEVTNMPEDEVLFSMTDLTGKVLISQKLLADNVGHIKIKLPIPNNINTGLYLLSIITDTKTISRKILVVK